MIDYPKNLVQFIGSFRNEDDCLKYLASVKWRDGFECLKCKKQPVFGRQNEKSSHSRRWLFFRLSKGVMLTVPHPYEDLIRPHDDVNYEDLG